MDCPVNMYPKLKILISDCNKLRIHNGRKRNNALRYLTLFELMTFSSWVQEVSLLDTLTIISPIKEVSRSFLTKIVHLLTKTFNFKVAVTEKYLLIRGPHFGKH